MYTLNMSEAHFVERIEAFVVELFLGSSNEAERMRVFRELNKHLKKAKEQQMLSYEGETHNALFLFSAFSGESLEAQFWNLNDALDCAKRAHNIPLEAKVLSNMGACWMSEFYIQEAKECFDEAIQLFHAAKIPTLGAIFAYSNRVPLLMFERDWKQAQADIASALRIAKAIPVTPATRNDYARGLYNVYVYDVLLNLVTKKYANAHKSLEISRNLIQQIESEGLMQFDTRLEAYYALIAEGNKAHLEAWNQERRKTSLTHFGLESWVVEVMILIAVGQYQYLPDVTNFALEIAPITCRARLRDFFRGLGL